MANPGVELGRTVGPFDACLTAELIARYGAATDDPSPLVLAGRVAPPVALVTQIWQAQEGARPRLVSPYITENMTSGVHGEHEVMLHRPVVPDEPLLVTVEGWGARSAGRNSPVTLHYSLRTPAGEPVAEQWWTTVFLGVACDAVGTPPPDHSFPEAARERRLGTYTVTVEASMAHRYAEVTGDWSAHHFSVEGAQRSGFDRPFIHGLCTMALCAQGVVALAAGGDPERVRRVAVRFATPTFLGDDLHVHVYDAGELGIAFEGESAGARVIADGRAELF